MEGHRFLAGETLDQGSFLVALSSRQSQKVKTLDLQGYAAKYGANNLLTWLKLEVDGEIVSENLVLLTMPKELKLADPELADLHPSFGGMAIPSRSNPKARALGLARPPERGRPLLR